MTGMDEASESTEFDASTPSPARIYDYWLGGSNNFAVDRDVAERAAAEMPTLRAAIWANRAFLRRAVRYLVEEEGVDQFLDLGSGVPTVGNVHEIAQAVTRTPRSSTWTSTRSRSRTAADCSRQRPGHRSPGRPARPGRPACPRGPHRPDRLLPPGRASLLIAVLHFMPDTDRPGEIVRTYRERMSPGSFLAISHAADDTDLPTEQAKMIEGYSGATKVPFIHRDADQLANWFDGLEIVPPGITQTTEWRPDTEPMPILRTNCALGRKPVR